MPNDLIARLPVLFSQLELDLLTSRAHHERRSLAEFLRAKLDLPHRDSSKIEYDAECAAAELPAPALRLHVPR